MYRFKRICRIRLQLKNLGENAAQLSIGQR